MHSGPVCLEACAMKVKDLQTSDVRACNTDTNLAKAAQIMWDCDCGVVPVVYLPGFFDQY